MNCGLLQKSAFLRELGNMPRLGREEGTLIRLEGASGYLLHQHVLL